MCLRAVGSGENNATDRGGAFDQMVELEKRLQRMETIPAPTAIFSNPLRRGMPRKRRGCRKNIFMSASGLRARPEALRERIEHKLKEIVVFFRQKPYINTKNRIEFAAADVGPVAFRRSPSADGPDKQRRKPALELAAGFHRLLIANVA